ncbi:MAG TPA: hypothetical protein VF453_16015 [Burkholderiaceae bacterium]
MNISGSTLMMSIQAVHAEAERIVAAVGGQLDELLPDDQELLMAFDKAAEELKQLYEVARKQEPGLTPYDQLVKT